MTPEQEIEDLKRRVAILERQMIPSQPVARPALPDRPAWGSEVKCSLCGMIWKGTMGYVCPNANCPAQLKAYSK